MIRNKSLEYFQQNPEISVLIIGAGINGIGTFRDLALQGVDVLIVDKSDFCSGASAASSHMVHGGIRYLENGEFRLVREAVQERNRLIENAPHYVKPLPTVIPIFKWFSGLFNAPLKFLGWLNKPSERGAIVIKAGLMIYDVYTREQGTVSRHQFKFRKASLKQYPQLNPRVICTAGYYDGSMLSPERICIDLLLDGEAANPRAQAINYVAVEGASADTVTLRDKLTGDIFKINPKIVINAAGPWIDFANRGMGYDTHFIGGTKGSHLILNHPQLRTAIGENEFFYENKDGRIVLIFPLFDKVIVGTSDLPIDDPDQARCTEEEVDYFLEMIKIVFPYINVDRSHIIYRFSGVRPLPASEADSPGQISRDHSIREFGPDQGINFPIFNLIGGKWTSFRAFSEQATDKTLEYLHLTRVINTSDLPIGGGKNFPTTETKHLEWITAERKRTGLSDGRIKTLLKRYGSRAVEIADYIAEGEDIPLQRVADYSQRELCFIIQRESAVHLDDLLLRRTMLAKLGQLTKPGIVEITHMMGEELSWSNDEKEDEILRTLNLLDHQHGINFN